nr:acVLRF1 family peptidyl-tRNA hydrolase [Saccharothrix syringae]
MSRVRPAAGGGRAVEVDPERLTGWFSRFAGRHGGVTTTSVSPHEWVATAADGTTASVITAFGEFTRTAQRQDAGLVLEPLLSNALAPRRLGLLLVRLGGHGVGVTVNGRVLESTTDSHQVHGRSKAGGWSQQRFARRREGQARVALRAAADDAARFLVPRLGELDAVVLGGDRQALDALRADRRLAAVFALASPRVLDVPDPRRAVLDEAALRARAVEIVVRPPAAALLPDAADLAGLADPTTVATGRAAPASSPSLPSSPSSDRTTPTDRDQPDRLPENS